eukprot:GHVN01030646.1.p1 GENE.GHVN01030646.1~~GHVN01030646.1.p1  ORF type:complete len:279 (+),score=79.27 GHVN01030646.1:306-1142(+)
MILWAWESGQMIDKINLAPFTPITAIWCSTQKVVAVVAEGLAGCVIVPIIESIEGVNPRFGSAFTLSLPSTLSSLAVSLGSVSEVNQVRDLNEVIEEHMDEDMLWFQCSSGRLRRPVSLTKTLKQQPTPHTASSPPLPGSTNGQSIELPEPDSAKGEQRHSPDQPHSPNQPHSVDQPHSPDPPFALIEATPALLARRIPKLEVGQNGSQTETDEDHTRMDAPHLLMSPWAGSHTALVSGPRGWKLLKHTRDTAIMVSDQERRAKRLRHAHLQAGERGE